MRPAWHAVVLVFTLFMASLAHSQSFAGGGSRERSPFTDILFEDDTAHVLVRDQWHEWLAINGMPYETILAEARRRDPGDAHRRIAEDLLVILAGLGVEPGETVALELRSLDNQRVIVMPNVPMTRDKRQQVFENRRERLERSKHTTVDAKLVFNELVHVVRVHHAYADLNGFDLGRAAHDEMQRTGDKPTIAHATLAAQRFIARLGDGHARVEDWLDVVPPGRLGFLLQHAEGGVVAFRRDHRKTRGEFIDDKHRFVASMDGVPIAQWIEAASIYVADGSSTLVRRRSTALLRYANLVRDELELPRNASIVVRLRNADGSSTINLELPITNSRSIYGVWPRRHSRVLDSGIGYIRLSRMHPAGAALDELERQLIAMANAPGLIIDLRGNGGGSRDAITLLVPWFLDPSEPAAARVVNVARARLSTGDPPQDPSGYLANRQAFPANWPFWTESQRAAIERFSGTFEPQWVPPRGEYSVPHYMVISRERGDPIYHGLVVVLMDGGCFSATDILLGALKGLPNVTLMGTPSSGGSARSRDHDVHSAGLSIRLASMVSYAPDGRLYDGNGIQPDVLVPIPPTDLIGQTDAQLDAAVEHLLGELETPGP